MWTDKSIKAISKPGKFRDPEAREKGISRGALVLRVKKRASGDGVSKSWAFEYKMNGAKWPTQCGLGGYPGVSLAQAREESRLLAQKVRAGIDPMQERKDAKAAVQAERLKCATFKDAAKAYIDTAKGNWSNPKHADQWTNTLERYVYPVIGDIPIADVTEEMVLAVLEPIWRTKTETATRVRQRMDSIFTAAEVRKLRTGPNPARLEALTHMGLAKPSKVKTVKHFASLPYPKMHEFLNALRQREGIAAKALAFLIYTASRTSPVILAEWDEIDFEKRVWTCPASHMKISRRGGQEIDHVVPLSDPALAILHEMEAFKESAFIFPRIGTGKGLSNGAFDSLLDRMEPSGSWGHITTHGFRSTFRSWQQDLTSHSEETAEMALAHVLGDNTLTAYARGQMMDKRR